MTLLLCILASESEIGSVVGYFSIRNKLRAVFQYARVGDTKWKNQLYSSAGDGEFDELASRVRALK
jgi:hypothetical protein